jgi:uncharacterized protein (DUF1800 family)
MMTARLRVVFGVLAAALTLAGPAPSAQGNRGAVPQNPDDKTVIHVLNRLGFGPTPENIARIRRDGLLAYIDEQLHPERIPDWAVAARLAGFETLGKSTRELAEDYFLPAMMERRQQQRRAAQDGTPDNPPPDNTRSRSPEQMETMRMQRAPMAELSQQKMLRAVYSERQLEEVLVDFWFNHFNVFVGKGQVRTYLIEYERDAIRPRVFGKFRDLLGATAKSPAMLFYLDNWQSTAAVDAPTSADMTSQRDDDARRRRAQREQEMRQRGRLPRPQDRMRGDLTLGDLPAQARRRGLNENYARELMELHTLGVDGGYTQKDVQEVARAFTGWTIAVPRQGGPFRFDPRLHDDGEKLVLGHRIKSGGGQKDGEQVLDLLVKHPSTAWHIATKLARRFIADDPPPALVTRAAERFRQTDGNLREVVRTIVTSPEFFAKEAYRAKVKSPFEFVVSAVRVTAVDAANALPLVQAVRDLGMPLYGAQPPTGYSDRAEAWVNSGALLNRMNFALTLSGGRMRGVGPGREAGVGGAEEARRALVTTALAGDLSDATATTAAKATTPAQAVALILGSPEFQKR